MMRGRGWAKFCNFWKKVFKPIVRVVTVIVAVFVPPVAAIITTVVNVADAIINVIDNAITKTETTEKASPGIKKLYILKNDNGDYENKSNHYTNSESIYLKSSMATTNIIFKVTEDSIREFTGYASVSNENINASNYYEFSDKTGIIIP